VFREGDEPLISLFAAARRQDLPEAFASGVEGIPVIEPRLVIRTRDGCTPGEYAAIRLSFGFPPGQIGG
jgi:hypothetical protein